MARAIDKRIMLDLIIEAKKTDPETGPFSEWLAEYLVDHLPTLTPPNELFTCAGCCYLNRVDTPCAHCIRSAGCADYFRRLPGKEE